MQGKKQQLLLILEISLMFTFFWLPSILSSILFSKQSELLAQSMHSSTFYKLYLISALPRLALLIFVMHKLGPGLASFGLKNKSPMNTIGQSLLALISCIAIAKGLGIPLEHLIGTTNKLTNTIHEAPSPSINLLPYLIATSITTGYIEELFFRVYLYTKLIAIGVRAWQAIVIQAILFGLGHGIQGYTALIITTGIGLGLGYLWHRYKNYHSLAIGHALYDLLIYIVIFYKALPSI